jgi:hypothetical protein
MMYRKLAAGVVLAAVVLTALILAGLVTIHGGDWSAGAKTTYCGIYWPHLDAYCQAGH